MSLQTFSKNLAFMMAKQNISNDDLSRQLKVSAKTVAAWKKARAYPRIPVLSDLCDVLEFYDIYRMINVDLKKYPEREMKKKLPIKTSKLLAKIVNDANKLLIQD